MAVAKPYGNINTASIKVIGQDSCQQFGGGSCAYEETTNPLGS